MTRHHWHCMYPFFQTLTSHLTLNEYHGSTDNNSWKDCHRTTRLQPRKKKKSEKKINGNSQRGHNIYKWNFCNFQTPEFCSILKKIKSYPFQYWETVIGLFCVNLKNNMNKKYWAEILTKLVKQKYISKVVVCYFFLRAASWCPLFQQIRTLIFSKL